MSVEDLGMRELGQVRSQRLDEVSFYVLFCFCSIISTVFCFLILYSWVRWYTLHHDETPHPCRQNALPNDYIPKAPSSLLILELSNV
jgi:hypothetical protein